LIYWHLMPTLAYHVVDVFTDRPFAGNPLAVVLDGDDLTTESMQAIAREFHLSETTFPLPSAVADYRVRIFTPESELPFAGHPSVGTAWLLARLGRIPVGAVQQECGAGLLPVVVADDGATLTGGEPSFGQPLAPGPLAAAVGLELSDLVGPPPRSAGTGLDWTYLQVSNDVVARVRPNYAAMREAGMDVYVHSWDPSTGLVHARGFVPDIGEDPATGSAALGLGVYLAGSGLLPDGEATYTVRQGIEIQRPSTLECTVVVSEGRAVRTTVHGQVAEVAVGELRRP
jgi:trans-2,3-dihydro-3-hydroxyanthranilate isomerase